jgi:DNA-binding NarL/FixJ family response regulator
MTLHVMLVDDHAVVRQGLKQILAAAFKRASFGEAANSQQTLERVWKEAWDIVILDLTMPGMGGRETLVRLRAEWPDCRILICTMHETPALIDHTLQAGAAGYISKNSSPEVLVNAVRKIAAGQRYIDAELAQTMLARNGRTEVVGMTALSPREFEILCLYAEAHSVDDIAAKLSLSSKTVANNLTTIKDKLQVSTTAELVRLAISKGLASV